jgi:hypothetical protein
MHVVLYLTRIDGLKSMGGIVRHSCILLKLRGLKRCGVAQGGFSYATAVAGAGDQRD